MFSIFPHNQWVACNENMWEHLDVLAFLLFSLQHNSHGFSIGLFKLIWLSLEIGVIIWAFFWLMAVHMNVSVCLRSLETWFSSSSVIHHYLSARPSYPLSFSIACKSEVMTDKPQSRVGGWMGGCVWVWKRFRVRITEKYQSTHVVNLWKHKRK